MTIICYFLKENVTAANIQVGSSIKQYVTLFLYQCNFSLHYILLSPKYVDFLLKLNILFFKKMAHLLHHQHQTQHSISWFFKPKHETNSHLRRLHFQSAETETFQSPTISNMIGPLWPKQPIKQPTVGLQYNSSKNKTPEGNPGMCIIKIKSRI